MSNKRRRDRQRFEKGANGPAEGLILNPDSLSQRLPKPLTLLVFLGLYGWMLTWWKGFLYSFYTTHLQDNIRTIGAFVDLLSQIRFGVIATNLPDIIWTGAIFASALSLGRIALHALRLDLRETWGRNFYALGVGFGFLSLILLTLGVVGFWTKWVMIALVVIPIAAAGLMRYAGASASGQVSEDQGRAEKITFWEGLGCALLTAYLLMNFMAAMTPEHFYDSLVYHLAMPKLYLLHQRIVPTPNMIYSGVPFGTEMLYGLALALGTETSAKLLHFGFGVLIAATIYSWCLKFANRRVALLATLLFYSAPLVCFASSVAKVELPMTFYLLLAVLLILETMRLGELESDAKPLILAGLLAGFAFGTKYNAGLYIPVLALPLVYKQLQAERFDSRMLLSQVCFFFGATALTASPWLIKNWFFYHNPTYPFLNDVFKGSATANVAGLRSDAHARDLASAFTTWPGFKSFIGGIWNPVAHAMDGYVGPTLQIGLPWLFLARWKTIQQRGLFIVTVGLWLAWALHSSLSRFVLPAVPLYCILVASALWLTELPRRLRLAIVAIFFYTMTINMARVFLMQANPGTWKVSYGRMTKSDYLLHEHPSYNAPYYAGAKFINANLPQDATVLFIGEERGYYSERKFITASVFDVNPMLGLANSSADADELLANLKRKGITHLLVNAGSEHYHRWLEGLPRGSRARYESLLNVRAKLIFNHVQDLPNDRSWVQVYELGSVSGRAGESLTPLDP